MHNTGNRSLMIPFIDIFKAKLVFLVSKNVSVILRRGLLNKISLLINILDKKSFKYCFS